MQDADHTALLFASDFAEFFAGLGQLDCEASPFAALLKEKRLEVSTLHLGGCVRIAVLSVAAGHDQVLNYIESSLVISHCGPPHKRKLPGIILPFQPRNRLAGTAVGTDLELPILQCPKCQELRRYHKGEVFQLRVREEILAALVCRMPHV